MHTTNVIAVTVALLGAVGSAHPGHNVAHEAAERRSFLGNVKRASLAHCSEKLKARGVEKRNILRRQKYVEAAREKRALLARDLNTILNTTHNETGVTVSSNSDDLFAGNHSCVLTPEVTQGPYYVGGEYVHSNLTEDQQGLSIILDYQVIDVNTCEPVPNIYLEMWHCNATGVYSGIVASGNGDSSDETNINKTFLRGIQQTDSDGVAQFNSIFPGHYTSRSTHIHVMAHVNSTELANHTLGTVTYASHVGQTFFDQDLISQVELLSPYNTNTQELTTNANDSILSEEVATDGVDPVMEYTMLGNSLSDGLLAWLAFGINSTNSYSITPAAFYYEGGGTTNPASPSLGDLDGTGPSGNSTGGPSGAASTSTA